MIDLVFFFGTTIVFLLLGWIVGGSAERKHLERLDKIFSTTRCLLSAIKTFPGGSDPGKGGELVVAEVVVANDYLKTFLAGLRQIFGGELKSYQSLMRRARAEVTARLIEQATEKGYDAVCNIRIEFSRIGIGFAVIGSGTAYLRAPGA